MDRLVTRCRRTGVQYVIIDTTTKTFAGNQNDPRHVTAFVDELQKLAIAIDGIVILTQHPSMRGRLTGTGESGSVQWENAVRSRLYLHTHKAKGLILEGMKANYSEKPEPLALEFKHGVFAIRTPELPRDHTESGSLFNS
jgi:RecA-family ATPase